MARIFLSKEIYFRKYLRRDGEIPYLHVMQIIELPIEYYTDAGDELFEVTLEVVGGIAKFTPSTFYHPEEGGEMEIAIVGIISAVMKAESGDDFDVTIDGDVKAFASHLSELHKKAIRKEIEDVYANL